MEQIGKALSRVNRVSPASLSSEPRRPPLSLPAKTDSDGIPVLYDPEVDNLSRLVCWRGDDGSIELTRPLTAGERSLAEGRAAALRRSLASYSEEQVPEVEAALAAMFAGFRQMRSDQDPKTTVRITRHVLREFPAWIIKRLCLRIAQGRTALNPSWPPSDADLARQCDDATLRFRDALRRAEEVISAEVSK